MDREAIYPPRGIAKLAVLSVRSMLPAATKALATISVYPRLCLSLPKDGCVDFILTEPISGTGILFNRAFKCQSLVGIHRIHRMIYK